MVNGVIIIGGVCRLIGIWRCIPFFSLNKNISHRNDTLNHKSHVTVTCNPRSVTLAVIRFPILSTSKTYDKCDWI